MPAHPFARPRGRTVEFTIESEALKDNLLGDPHERSVAVYLPEGYDEGTEEYPLLVDLVGFTGSGFSHLNWKMFSESVPQRVDRLRGEEKMGPAILAFPDCFTSLGGNQYVNSAALGRWADFLIEEMIPALEAKFRIAAGRDHRAVFGKSSGGYGSIFHGLRHADAWNGVACHSGDMSFELCYAPDFPKVLDALAQHDRSVEAYLEALEEKVSLSNDDVHVMMILAMAASYDPDPLAHKGIRLPVDLYTAERIAERWQRWLDYDPVVIAGTDEGRANLASLGALYIDCGDRDQYHLVYGARTLHGLLTDSNVPHRYEEFDDDHSSIDYRMDESLPFLYQAVT